MGRAFAIGERPYRACCGCGAQFRYSLETMSIRKTGFVALALSHVLYLKSPRYERGAMFRVEMRDATNAVIVKLQGRLIGEYAEYARSLVTSCNTNMKLIIDLTEVTAVDSVGEEVLSFFGRLGAEFIAGNIYARYVCEQLNLPAARPGLRTRRREVARSCTPGAIER